jgi:uncharacterized protein YkwD
MPSRGKSIGAAFVVALTVAVGVHAAPRVPSPAELLAPSARCGQPTEIGVMLCYHNFARVQDGLKPLTIDARLSTFGKQKLAQIVKCGTFTHSPCGADAFAGFPAGFTAAGENLVYWEPTGTVRQQMTTWLNSPDHLENIVSPSYSHVGFAVYDGPAFGYSEVRMWIADFGS